MTLAEILRPKTFTAAQIRRTRARCQQTRRLQCLFQRLAHDHRRSRKIPHRAEDSLNNQSTSLIQNFGELANFCAVTGVPNLNLDCVSRFWFRLLHALKSLCH